jgi:hypothetical protein
MVDNMTPLFCPKCKHILFLRDPKKYGKNCVGWECKWNNKYPDDECKPIGDGYNVRPNKYLCCEDTSHNIKRIDYETYKKEN